MILEAIKEKIKQKGKNLSLGIRYRV